MMAFRKVLLFALVLVGHSNAVSNTTTVMSANNVTVTTTPMGVTNVTTVATTPGGGFNTTIPQSNNTTTPQSNNQLVLINGDLVRLVNNCTVGVSSSCPYNYCCTKKFMVYVAGFSGSKPIYQLECKPLRRTGEFCYFKTPEQYCPCATRCHTNGFYGSCV